MSDYTYNSVFSADRPARRIGPFCDPETSEIFRFCTAIIDRASISVGVEKQHNTAFAVPARPVLSACHAGDHCHNQCKLFHVLFLLCCLSNIAFAWEQLPCTGVNAYAPCNLYESSEYLSCQGAYAWPQYACASDGGDACAAVCGGCGSHCNFQDLSYYDAACRDRYCRQSTADSIRGQISTYAGLCDVAYNSCSGAILYCDTTGCVSSSSSVSVSSSSSSSSSFAGLSSSLQCYDYSQAPYMCAESNYDQTSCDGILNSARAACHASCHPFVEYGNNSLGWNGGCIMGSWRHFYGEGYNQYYFGCEGRLDPSLCALSSGESSSASGGGGEGGSSIGSGSSGSGSGGGGEGGGEGSSGSGSGSGGGEGGGTGEGDGFPCGYDPWPACDVYVTNPNPTLCAAHPELCSDIGSFGGKLDSIISLLEASGGDSSYSVSGFDSLSDGMDDFTGSLGGCDTCGSGVVLDTSEVEELPESASSLIDSTTGMFVVHGSASGCPRLPNIEVSFNGGGGVAFAGSVPLDICTESYYIGGRHVLELIGRVLIAFTWLACFITLVKSISSENSYSGVLGRFKVGK